MASDGKVAKKKRAYLSRKGEKVDKRVGNSHRNKGAGMEKKTRIKASCEWREGEAIQQPEEEEKEIDRDKVQKRARTWTKATMGRRWTCMKEDEILRIPGRGGNLSSVGRGATCEEEPLYAQERGQGKLRK